MPLKDRYPVANDSGRSGGSLAYFFPSPDEGSEAGQFPWLRSDCDSSKEDALCYISQEINFQYLAQNRTEHGIYLGTYGEVRRRICVFCRLILDDQRIAMNMFREEGCLDADRVFLSSTNKHLRSSWSRPGARDLIDSFVLPVWVYRRGPGAYGIGVAYSVMHIISKQVNMLSARLIPPSYDSEAILEWLHDCSSFNDETPGNSWMNYIDRFTDTTDHCLVKAQNESSPSVVINAKFAALSYVRGKDGQQMTSSRLACSAPFSQIFSW